MTIKRIQFRRGTATEWAAANTILAAGEPGFETDTGKSKTGTGTTPWNLLNYNMSEIPDVSGKADKTYVDGLVTNEIKSVTPTTDELVDTVYIGACADGSTTYYNVPFNLDRISLWAAPFDARLLSVAFTFDNVTQATDATNYYRFVMRRRDSTAALTQIVTKDTSTSGEAITAAIPWTFDYADWDSDQQDFAKGDTLVWRMEGEGSMSRIALPALVTVRYSPR